MTITDDQNTYSFSTFAPAPCGTHDFEQIGSFFHRKGDDPLVDYATLFCRLCGETREILVKDRRKPEEKPIGALAAGLVEVARSWYDRDSAIDEIDRCPCCSCEELRTAIRPFMAEDDR